MRTNEATFARWRITSTLRALQATLTGPQRPLDHLEDARHARDAILDAIDLLAVAARREGATYAQIGRALGITRQAARQAALTVELDQRRRAEDFAWRMPPRARDRRPRASSQPQQDRPRVVG